MNALTILSLARDLTNTSSDMTNLDDVSLTDYLNMEYHAVEDWINSSYKDDIFQETYKTDTVLDQTQYLMPANFKKVQEVSVKWNSTDTYYDVLDRIESDYVKWGDDKQAVSGRRFFDIQGSTIDIFPAPEEAITDWLKVKCIVNLDDITYNSASTDIFPNCMHSNALKRVLVYRMRVLLYRLKGELDKVGLAMQELQREQKEVIKMVRSLEVVQPKKGWRHLDNYFMS